MSTINIPQKGIKAYSSREYGAVYTGFEAANKNKGIVITGNATTRKVTVSGTFTARYKMEVVSALISGWESPAHDNDPAKSYMLCYNGAFTWVDLTTTPLDISCLFIAYTFYDPTAATWVYIRECHGFMSESAHYLIHKNFGTFRDDSGLGGIMAGYTIDSTTPANRRPDTSAIDIIDEDVATTVAAHTTKLYNQGRLVGAGATATFTVDQADMPKLSTNNPYYNLYTGGAWTDALMPANSVASIWQFVLPVAAGSEKYGNIFVQPQWITQAAGGSANQITTAVNTELSKPITNLAYGTFLGLVPESVTINRIVIVYTTGNWYIRSIVQVTGSRVLQVQGQTGTFGDVFGAASATDGDNVVFDGTSGKLIKSSAHIKETATGVGIGTTSPTEKLDVNGGINATGNMYLPVNQMYGCSGQGNTGVGMLSTGTNILQLRTAATGRLTILADGNVGIGTTFPAEKLHAYAASICKALIETDSNGIAGIKFAENTAGTLYGFEFLYTGVDDTMRLHSRNFAGNDAVRMVFMKNGHVCVGDSDPTERLEVVGAGAIGDLGVSTNSELSARPRINKYIGETTGAVVTYILLCKTLTTAGAFATTGFDGVIDLYRGSTTTYNNAIKIEVSAKNAYTDVIINKFNVYLGRAGLPSDIDLVTLDYGGVNYLAIRIPAVADLSAFYTGRYWGSAPSLVSGSGVTNVTLSREANITTTAGGYVGINTTAPAEKLDVSGNIKAFALQINADSGTADADDAIYFGGRTTNNSGRIRYNNSNQTFYFEKRTGTDTWEAA